jgi:hypothetical protein
VEARTSDPEFAQILDSTKGLVFFGTPFRGTNTFLSQGELLQLIAEHNDVENSALQILAPGNDNLENTLYEYSRMGHRIPAVCFYETKSTDVARIVNGREIKVGQCFYSITASLIHVTQQFVVDKYSACLAGAEPVGMERDHFDMNKFATPDDPEYKRILFRLRRLDAGLEAQRQLSVSSTETISTVNDSKDPEIQSKLTFLNLHLNSALSWKGLKANNFIAEFDPTPWKESGLEQFNPENKSEMFQLRPRLKCFLSGFAVDCRHCWLLSEQDLLVYEISTGSQIETTYKGHATVGKGSFKAAAMGITAAVTISSDRCMVESLDPSIVAHQLSPVNQNWESDSVAIFESSHYILVALAYHAGSDGYITLFNLPLAPWHKGCHTRSADTCLRRQGSKGTKFPVHSKWLDFSKDGKYIVCVTSQNSFVVWEVRVKSMLLREVCAGTRKFTAVSGYFLFIALSLVRGG